MSELVHRFQAVQKRIQHACETYHRSQSAVQLLAVSKTKPLADIEVIADQGQQAFGENYVQEALEKIAKRPDLEWHFIGPIQSNKTRPIAENFSWVHSVDRLKIAERLSQQRPSDLPPLKVLLEVNVDEEVNKAGLNADELFAVADAVMQLPNLELRGLMAIPRACDDFETQRLPFTQLRHLLEALQTNYPNANLDTLSMGMSADLEAAIAEGATMVRIGTDIFGARNYTNE